MGKIESDLHPWQVERRKQQNVKAQRKRRLRLKEERQSKSPPNPSRTDAMKASSISSALISAIFNCFNSDTERTNIAIIMAAENFSLRDVIKYGMISLGCALSCDLYRLAEDLPFHSWILSAVAPALVNVDLEAVLRAGVRTLVCLQGPQVWSGELSPPALAKGKGARLRPPLIGDPAFTIYTGFFTASLANCHLLGLDPHSIMNHDAKSPLVRSAHSGCLSDRNHENNSICDSKSGLHQRPDLSEDFTNDMRPTKEQLTIPHHPYLDIIPWPSFRARAIVAASMDPPLIDKNELCLDLLSNGLHCHSVPGVSLHRRGEGTPWDCRSWEAKSWFLRKWSFLVGGSDIQQSSSWWRSR